MDIFKLLLNEFHFLSDEFGFVEIKQEKNNKYIGEYLVIYQNKISQTQIEISLSASWFCCILRQLMNDVPAKYSDSNKVLNIEDLAILEDEDYNHFDYVVTGNGLLKVLKNVKQLIKRNKKVFTTPAWVDTSRIRRLKSDKLLKLMDLNSDLYSMSRISGFEKLTSKIGVFLSSKGYFLYFESKEEPPYSYSSLIEAKNYNNGKDEIEISQEDWRDEYFIYYFAYNNVRVFEFDLADIDEIVSKIKYFLQK